LKALKFLLPFALLFIGGCVEDRELPEGAGGSGGYTLASGGSLQISSVFPRTPILAEGGSVGLTAIVTNGAGTVLESTAANPIAVEWTSSSPNVAQVSDSGFVVGKSIGSARITARAKRDGRYSSPYTILVQVVERNSLDVSELFFNPMQAFIDINGERVFKVSAVDHSGAATSLTGGSLYIETSNNNVSVEPREMNVTAGASGSYSVDIKLRGLEKGFTFITPIYTLSANDNQLIRITGTPLTVQVKDSVEAQVPNGWTGVDAGRYLSIAVSETSGYKTIHAAQYDATSKGLVYSNFYSSWAHATIDGGKGTSTDAGVSAQIAASPYDSNRDKPIVVYLRNGYVYLRYQPYLNSANDAWNDIKVSSAPVIDANHTYPQGSLLLGITAFRDPDRVSAADQVHIAYFDAVSNKICAASLKDNPIDIDSATHQCVALNAPIHSLSISHNRLTGEPRFAYANALYNHLGTDGNYTEIPEALYYAARQSGSFHKELVEGISGNIGSVSLSLDRVNKPIMAVKEGSYVRLYSREPYGDKYKWQMEPVGGIDPVQGDISGVSFALDAYNEPRVAYAAVTTGGSKIHYARKPPFRNLVSRWVIEEPGANESGEHGASNAIAVDSANRAHLVYAVDSKRWFNYWAEPNFFDYRTYPSAQYTGADIISTGAVNAYSVP
jgi:hypothetical protein